MQYQPTRTIKKHHTEERILGISKEAELGNPLPELLRQHVVSSGTFYRWKSRFGGLEPSQLSQLRQLERENNELKKIVADQALDIRMLKDVNSKNW